MTVKERLNKLTREEYIELARKCRMTEKDIKKYLKMRDDDEAFLKKQYNIKDNDKILIPYELLPIDSDEY